MKRTAVMTRADRTSNSKVMDADHASVGGARTGVRHSANAAGKFRNVG